MAGGGLALFRISLVEGEGSKEPDQTQCDIEKKSVLITTSRVFVVSAVVPMKAVENSASNYIERDLSILKNGKDKIIEHKNESINFHCDVLP